MSNTLNFPGPGKVTVINEEHFEQFADVALMQYCFEHVCDAVELVTEGGSIGLHDETHANLHEVCMALAVMFKRRTGYTVQQVCSDHLEAKRRSLMAGEEPRAHPIPVKQFPIHPLPVSAFRGLDDVSLAQAASNYSTRVLEIVQGNCPAVVELQVARSHALDALNAISVLAARLKASGLQDQLLATGLTVAGPETLQ